MKSDLRGRRSWGAPPVLVSTFLPLCVLVGGAAAAVPDAPLTLRIHNEMMELASDAGGAFSIAPRNTSSAVVLRGKFNEIATGAKVVEVDDPAFGIGQSIELKCASGNRHSLLLFPNLPFALFRSALHNHSAEAVVRRNYRPLSVTLQLGEPADALRALGTAGLTAPDKNPGSYLYLAIAEPDTRHGVVGGWITHDRGNGVLFSKVENGQVFLEPQVDYGRLRIGPGQTAQTETLGLGYFEDARLGLEAWADAVAKVYRIHLPSQLTGYCTWYSSPHGGASDETHIVELAQFAARELKPFGFDFVQIDDRWQMGCQRNGPAKNFATHNPQGPYPHGMKAVADSITALGLTPGLWFMPFARDHLDPLFLDHPDWFVKKPDGQFYETSWGGTSLDMTQPGAREHLRDVVKIIRGWGFRYFKMDGLWTGLAAKQVYVNDGYVEDGLGDAIFHDLDMTNIEAMRDGLKLVRAAAGSDIFFSGCNLSQNMRSFSGAVGLVDSMRVGPDNGSRWPANPNGRVVGTLLAGPYHGSLKYFMHGRLWWNDPDPVYVRVSMPLTHAQLITSWVAISGQFNLSTDWLPALPPERLAVLKHTMPSHGLLPRPVDLFDNPFPRIWLLSDTRKSPRRDVIALYNWDQTEISLDYPLAKIGLDPKVRYAAFDYWANRPMPDLPEHLRMKLPAESCAIVALCPVSDQPRLLSTSRHVTQGIVDVVAEHWNPADHTLSGTSRLVANDPYELRVHTFPQKARWLASPAAFATLTDADKAAGVKVVSLTFEPAGLIRILLRSPASREVTWTLQFHSRQ